MSDNVKVVVYLSQLAVESLDQLADLRGVTRSEMVDILIGEEVWEQAEAEVAASEREKAGRQ